MTTAQDLLRELEALGTEQNRKTIGGTVLTTISTA
jgi:hypothetical protein